MPARFLTQEILMSLETAVESRMADPIALLYPELDAELAMTRKMLAIVPSNS